MNAYSAEINDSALIEALNNLNQDHSPNFLCEENSDPLKFKDCNEDQEKILRYAAAGISERTKYLLKQIDWYDLKKLTSTEQRFMRKTKEVMECIDKKLAKKMEFSCKPLFSKDCNNKKMYVKTFEPIPRISTHRVHVCRDAFHYTQEELSGIIFHEVSHLCGTQDLEYLVNSDLEINEVPMLKYDLKLKRNYETNELGVKKRLLPKLGSKNADSYNYWYRYGFCLPGRNCE